MPEPSSTGPFMFYFLGNESGSTKILLQMWNGYHGLGGGEFSGKRVDMSFAFKDLAIEHICDDFREEDLPSVWTLAGELLEDRVAAAIFAQDSGEYFSKFDVNRKQRPDWPWYASLGATFCRVTYRWYDYLQKYDLYQVTLWMDLELPRHFVTDFSEDSLNALTADQLTPVTELGLSLPSEQEMAAYIVLGHLEQLQPVEDESGAFLSRGSWWTKAAASRCISPPPG